MTRIDDVADREPVRRLFICRKVTHDLVDEREKYRLQREVVPIVVERRRPQHHVAGSDAPFRHRDRSIIKARDHPVVRSVFAFFVANRLGLQRDGAISEESRRREIAAAWGLEDLEYWMARVELC